MCPIQPRTWNSSPSTKSTSRSDLGKPRSGLRPTSSRPFNEECHLQHCPRQTVAWAQTRRKLQAPGKHQTSSPKHVLSGLGAWFLECLWSLDAGAWSFGAVFPGGRQHFWSEHWQTTESTVYG